MNKSILALASLLATVTFGVQAHAQAYGEPINMEQANKAATAAVEEAKKNNWAMAITVVGPTGDLIYFTKMDNTQYGSIAVSQQKARAAALFRRPTKAFEDRVASGGGGIAVLSLEGVIASDGGLPIVAGGKIIGAIGCSGATGAQDAQVCTAGVNALK